MTSNNTILLHFKRDTAIKQLHYKQPIFSRRFQQNTRWLSLRVGHELDPSMDWIGLGLETMDACLILIPLLRFPAPPRSNSRDEKASTPVITRRGWRKTKALFSATQRLLGRTRRDSTPTDTHRSASPAGVNWLICPAVVCRTSPVSRH